MFKNLPKKTQVLILKAAAKSLKDKKGRSKEQVAEDVCIAVFNAVMKG